MAPMRENTELMNHSVAEQQPSDDPQQTSGSMTTAQDATTPRSKTVHRTSTSTVPWARYVFFDSTSHMIQLYV
jgi:hypothetical protein